MTKTYYPIDTAAGQTHHVIAGRTSQTTDPGTGSPVEYQQSISGQANDASFLCLYSPSDEPNSADWPAASAGDPYKVQLDVATAGADLTFGLYVARGGHLARVNSALSSDLENAGVGTAFSWSGTGLKTGNDEQWNPTSGSASDRIEAFICVDNSAMMAETLGVNLNTSNTYLQGPWVDAPPASRPVLAQVVSRQSTHSASLL